MVGRNDNSFKNERICHTAHFSESVHPLLLESVVAREINWCGSLWPMFHRPAAPIMCEAGTGVNVLMAARAFAALLAQLAYRGKYDGTVRKKIRWISHFATEDEYWDSNQSIHRVAAMSANGISQTDEFVSLC